MRAFPRLLTSSEVDLDKGKRHLFLCVHSTVPVRKGAIEYASAIRLLGISL